MTIVDRVTLRLVLGGVYLILAALINARPKLIGRPNMSPDEHNWLQGAGNHLVQIMAPTTEAKSDAETEGLN